MNKIQRRFPASACLFECWRESSRGCYLSWPCGIRFPFVRNKWLARPHPHHTLTPTHTHTHILHSSVKKNNQIQDAGLQRKYFRSSHPQNHRIFFIRQNFYIDRIPAGFENAWRFGMCVFFCWMLVCHISFAAPLAYFAPCVIKINKQI